MKKILSLFFVFLLIIGSVYSIDRVRSSSLEEEKDYYRSLIENPPADIESYEFTDYDIKMILEVKEDIKREQHIKELKAEREKYIPKENSLKNNNKRWRTPSEEETEMFEKLKQNNQQKLEQMDKVIMLLEEE